MLRAPEPERYVLFGVLLREFDPQKWEAVRERGILRFLLINGVLFWAIPLMAITGYFNESFTNGFLSERSVVHTSLWVLGGLAYGFILWHQNQSRYNHGRRQPKEAEPIRWWASPLTWVGVPVLIIIAWAFAG